MERYDRRAGGDASAKGIQRTDSGMTDEGITQWVASLPACAELTNKL